MATPGRTHCKTYTIKFLYKTDVEQFIHYINMSENDMGGMWTPIQYNAFINEPLSFDISTSAQIEKDRFPSTKYIYEPEFSFPLLIFNFSFIGY